MCATSFRAWATVEEYLRGTTVDTGEETGISFWSVLGVIIYLGTLGGGTRYREATTQRHSLPGGYNSEAHFAWEGPRFWEATTWRAQIQKARFAQEAHSRRGRIRTGARASADQPRGFSILVPNLVKEKKK